MGQTLLAGFNASIWCSQVASPAYRLSCLLVVLLATVLYGVATTLAADGGPLPAELRLKPGFRLELVYRVPPSQGSWVCLTCNRRGRLVASDQQGKLYLIHPAPVGAKDGQSRVEPLPLDLGEAQGLACVGDDLYVVVNSSSKLWVSGLHRARDADGDGRWDSSELLRELQGHGEHGPHAVIAGADGKSLYVCCGNHTDPTAFDSTALPHIGPEDVLLARLTSPTPFQATRRMPPGGWIARTDLDGRRWELVSCGYRNQYDVALSREGELFTYDSDMEYDIGTPWYRPTRVCHASSGTEYGWRSNSGPFPSHYPDTLPTVAELGPGSPTGLAFGYETEFPANYRDALFAADWGRGVIHTLHLEPYGSSYRATAETLVQAAPLPVTDLAANAADGALYFTTGGRGIESALYRLTYVGEEGMVEASGVVAATDSAAASLRSLRRRLEALHRPHPDAISTAWPMLDHADRSVRYAARTAIEHQAVVDWRDKALAESIAGRRTAACLGLVRADGGASPTAIVNALSGLAWRNLGTAARHECLRAYEVIIARHGRLPSADAAGVREQLLEHFPDDDVLMTRSMASVLTRLNDASVTPRIVGQLDRAWADEDQIHLAHTLCDVVEGWTPPLRQRYFDRLAELIERHRESTLRTYLDQMASHALALTPEMDRPRLARQIAAVQETNQPAAPPAREFVKHWTVDAAVEAIDASGRSPDSARGERLFALANCATCHQVKGRGRAVGPDLTTVGSRFSLRDLLAAIVDPDQSISDQYQQAVFEIGGRVIVGRIVDHRGGDVRIATDMTDPKRGKFVPLESIDAQAPSEISPMPRGLVDTLTDEELVDLVGFLRAN